jgi:murein DD-endopeptidase MepM/ murein hydrolase activator NlpD
MPRPVRSHPLARIATRLLATVLLYAAMAFALPWLDSWLYLTRLMARPVPARLAIPVAHVQPRALRDTWHADRDGGRRRHEGIDIFARRGTPVHSTTEGIVTRVGQNRLGGNVVWVMGPGGQRHYYAHLDSFAHIRAGERVQPGALLGFVGNTGNAKGTPPHLHYGIYARGSARNPYPLLKAPGPDDR